MDELIKLFNANNVRYLLIGGQAVRLQGLPRFSMDWDFYVPGRDIENVDRINRLLAEHLDVPLVPLGDRVRISSRLTRRDGEWSSFTSGRRVSTALTPRKSAPHRGLRRKTENRICRIPQK
ncbi:MAG: hypothetical protein R6V03_04470 [Kiritimatiellia bacterium]